MSIADKYVGQRLRAPDPPREAAAGSERRLLHGLLLASDAIAVVLALASAYILRFGDDEAGLAVGDSSVPYVIVAAGLAGVWWITLGLGHTRDPRIAVVGPQECRAIADWTLRLFGLLAILAFATKLQFARSFFVYAAGLGFLLLLAGRLAIHLWVGRLRKSGRMLRPILAIGDPSAVEGFAARLATEPGSGYRLAGRLIPGSPSDPGDPTEPGPGAPEDAADDVPARTTDVTRVVAQARALAVDAVAFVNSDQIDAESRRRIDWALREEGIDVVVVPPLDSTAGARLLTEYVGGIPLIHLFSGSPSAKQFAKALFDKIVATLALIVVAVPALAIAVVVKVTSPGPVLFIQERVGMNGHRFRMLKFRTMRVGAHDERGELAELDDGNGMLFKLKDDPRVTPIGRFLRRYSLDELPQFVNVLTGSMSVVGPRPPLPEEVARYNDIELRRLLVKPGITGLWQVGGRSDLSWEDSLRLDLHYVETWSVLKDTAICVRTVRAMVNGQGAY